MLSETQPSTALILNPLNSTARINFAFEQLGRSVETLSEVQQSAETGSHLAPADARFYSLMGIVAERLGDRPGASQFYNKALAILPTEIQALTRKLQFAIDEGSYVKAIDAMEVIAKRWPKYWPNVEGVLNALALRPESFTEMDARFGTNTVLRSLVITSLAKTDSTLVPAQQLLVQWSAQGIASLENLINLVTIRLIAQGQYAEAYSMFLQTRTATDSDRSGYVNNGTFSYLPSGNIFDWTIRPQAGVDVEIVNGIARALGADSTGSTVTDKHVPSALSIRFLDNPIRFRNVSQLVRLPAGSYRLAVSYKAISLVMPKPLKVGISCYQGKSDLGTISFEGGYIDQEQIYVDFEVPTESCELQQLFVYNDPLPMSWQNRYAGVLLVRRIAITSLGR